MLIKEQAVRRLQQLVVIPGDDLGVFRRVKVERALADDRLRGFAELLLGHLVGQEVAPRSGILHGDPRGDMVDDLAQEGVVAIALLFQVAAIGDVFDRGDPAALGERSVDDLEGAAIGQLMNSRGDRAFGDDPHDVSTEFLDVTVERAALLAMIHRLADVAAGLDDVVGEAEHVGVASVAGDDGAARVVEDQPLRHVVQGGVEPQPLRFQPLLRFAVLPVDQADDQIEDQRDHGSRKRGGRHHEACLLPPVGQRRGRGVGGDDDQREMRQRRRRSEPLFAVDRAPAAERLLAAIGQHLLHQRRVLEVSADQLFEMRIARQHLAFAIEQRDGRPLGQRDRREIVLVAVRIDPADHRAEEGAVRAGQPAGDDRGPFVDDEAADGFQQHRFGLRIRLEGLKVGP
ncbi:hypothetical protein ABH970_005398 [Bradyrhizobium ottawaense]